MNSGRQYNDGDLDMSFEMQLTMKDIEKDLGYIYVEPKAIVYELAPKI